MTQVLLFATVIAPFVAGIVEVVKKTVSLPKNFVPLIALVIGVGLGAAASPFTDMDLLLRLWAGAGAGLSATGLFEAVKQRFGKTKNNSKDKDVFNNQ
ncbi:holin [Salimicrobium jeotgali]|uniref:holin n=1 Tax=Salimicrobium jeotgali TaxID=1230341 RepID=UPI000C85C54D|nr:holin [Salimicrobium jeotgali]